MAKAKPPKKEKKEKVLRGNSLIIESLDGKEYATLRCDNTGAGLWLTSPDGSNVCIFNINGQMAIGYYSADRMNQKGGPNFMSLAISHNKSDGKPLVQYGNDKDETPLFINFEDLIGSQELLDRVKSLESRLQKVMDMADTYAKGVYQTEASGRAASSEVLEAESKPPIDNPNFSCN